MAEHYAFSTARFAVMGAAPSIRFMASKLPVSSTTAILTLKLFCIAYWCASFNRNSASLSQIMFGFHFYLELTEASLSF